MDIESVKVRGLTRREIKDLEQDGVVLAEVKAGDYAVVDRLLDMCCLPPVADKEALTPAETLALFSRVMDRTYLTAGEEKNSGSPRF